MLCCAVLRCRVSNSCVLLFLNVCKVPCVPAGLVAMWMYVVRSRGAT